MNNLRIISALIKPIEQLIGFFARGTSNKTTKYIAKICKYPASTRGYFLIIKQYNINTKKYWANQSKDWDAKPWV